MSLVDTLAVIPEGRLSCLWTIERDIVDGDEAWSTECNRTFDINNGTPSENGMHFCCFCGGIVREKVINAGSEE